MNKSEIIAQLQTEYPTLTKQIDGNILTLDKKEYDATLNSWADATLAKEAAKLEAEKERLTKISAYQKLGLTEAEIEALLPTPAKPIS